MERILIVRLGAMGDIVHTLPAAAALRAGIPGVRIGWVVEEHWSDLLSSHDALNGPGRTAEKPLVDAVHLVNTKAWRSALLSDETWRGLRAVITEMRESRYDVAVDFQGALKSAVFAQWSGAPVHIGFSHPRERAASMVYTRRLPTTRLHVVEQNLELAQAVVADAQPPTQEFLPRDPVAECWCEQELKRRAVREFVLISPGAGWGAKAWPAERYGELARALASVGIAALVNFAPGEDELARTTVAASAGSAQAISCPVSELIALTRRARLCVGGDSGPTQLAAMLGVPVVAIFGPTDPRRNGPWGAPAIVLRSALSQTSYSHSSPVEAGLLTITVAQVTDACRKLLESPRA